MIDRQALLSDLQALLKRLEADLLERSESTEIPDVGDTLRAEYDRAKKAERTAQNYEDWRSDAITQAAAAWVLSSVFVRFLEDNKLIDPPKIAGPKERLQQARDEHTLYFQDSQRAKLTDREYLLSVFDELAKLPGTKDVFGEHNPIRELPNWLSGDAAGELLRFFQKIDASTGDLIHDFTDPDWDTRFLGDLYQDLSEDARKKYALLQTPEFVEEFILDRTLDPALDEFGLDAPPVTDRQGKPVTEPGFRMIDPACGSGHFLLGAFTRILDRWQKQEPSGKIRELAQKTFDCIHGVDVNPYAVAIARFRLLLKAMKVSGIKRLADAPGFHFNLACGDSLLHAPLRGGQHVFDWELASEDVECEHAYQSEDLTELKRMLRSGIYHAIVANPPYITVKDKQLNQRYRKRFEACHMKYSLAVPFMERIFRMALDGGFTGQFTANSFMKREFGKKLIEEFFPKVDLTHVIDSSLVHIPDYGTPTVLIFGRNRRPLEGTIRAVLGIKREDNKPSDPAKGLVWSAICSQVDRPGTESEFVSTADVERETFHKHPWTVSGGGAAELKVWLDENHGQLGKLINSAGFMAIAGDEDVYIADGTGCWQRRGIPHTAVRPLIDGSAVRDWAITPTSSIIYDYDARFHWRVSECLNKHFWRFRTLLQAAPYFGKTKRQRGMDWREYAILLKEKLRTPLSIVFANVASHVHCCLERGSAIGGSTAQVVKLKTISSEDDHLNVLGCLNSSTGTFWIKQVCHDKGGGGIGGGIAAEAWERFKALNAGKFSEFPVPEVYPLACSKKLDDEARRCAANRPSQLGDKLGSRASVRKAKDAWESYLRRMIALQEDLDWRCYQSYGLMEADLSFEDPPEISFGERAFEIVMARKMESTGLATAWFTRHGSRPTTEIPTEWPEEYRRIVERRIKVIESSRNIGLLEQPEYKRRWNTEPWESQLEHALRSWLLNRLEKYFDIDGRMNEEGNPTARLDIALTTVAKLSDVARQDPQFMEVGEVYRDDAAFDVQRLVEELVKGEHVPLLPVLRYKPAGLRKRQEWEKTWALQRQEDSIEARTQLPQDDPQYLTEDQAQGLRQQEIGDIPVPPKYKGSDFISTGGARYWNLRGKLDVPKERWVSFPYSEGPDGTLVIAWAGYDHLQLARAISAYFVDIQERLGGRDDPRLVPLLACIIELLPWLKQWHHDIDPDYNQRMDEVFEGFVTEEAKNLGLTIDEIKSWEPPKKTASRKRRRAGT